MATYPLANLLEILLPVAQNPRPWSRWHIYAAGDLAASATGLAWKAKVGGFLPQPSDNAAAESPYWIADGGLTDATSPAIDITTPSGTLTTHTVGDGTLFRLELGVYYARIDLNAAGTWTYRFYSTGGVEVSTPSLTFTVQ